MKIIITGATGFVGRALTMRLLRDNHDITVPSRRPERVPHLLGSAVKAVALDDDVAFRGAVASADGIINLAGENLFNHRWSTRFKATLVDSRVALTRRLAASMDESSVLVSASAIGIYGEAPAEEVDESSSAGSGFLAELCREWEEAASAGARVALIRIGLVLGDGGAMARLLPPFRLGVGGRLGHGRQPMSWIHLRDLVELLAQALTDDRYTGPINAVSPNPVDNREFTRVLGRILGRPTIAPAPSPVLRLALGEAASVLLGGQRVRPSRLLELGFPFRHETIDSALTAIVTPPAGLAIQRDRGERIDGCRPHYELTDETLIDAPREAVFDFFSRAENLALLTPAWTRFEIDGPVPSTIAAGTTIRYLLSLGPIPVRWKTTIREFEAGERFVDAQDEGPYRLWWHEHRFVEEGQRTRMIDRARYRLPGGPFGRLIHHLVVRRTLLAIFSHRREAIELLFGQPKRPET